MTSLSEKISGNNERIPLDGSVRDDKIWAMRAARCGFRSVMSVRHDEATCEQATADLKRVVLPMLGDLRGKDVLEIGTGVGRFTSDLAQSANHVYGIDFTQAMLNRAKQAVTEPNVTLLRSNANSLPLKDASVDCVFELTVLQHIVDENDFKTALREAKRVLRAGGMMFLCGHLSPDETTLPIHSQLVHRPLDAYQAALSPLEIVEVRHTTCVDEDYTMMLVR